MRNPWARRPSPSLAEGPRVGIVTTYVARQGLATMARVIESSLGNRVQVFPVRKLSRLDRGFRNVRASRADRALTHDRVVAPGTKLDTWLRSLDVVILVERAAPRLCAHCREIGVRTVVVALPDWLPPEPADRVEQLGVADVCVAYGPSAARGLAADGLKNIVSLPFACDLELEKARTSDGEVVVYFNIGSGGPVDRRKVPLVLEVMDGLLREHDHLHFLCKLHPRARRSLGEIASSHPRMRVIDAEVTPSEMRALQREADVTLFPSRFEGVGYPVLESLHAGVPVLATDAAPMNEIVRDGVNGLLIPASPAGFFGAQAIHDVDRDGLREAVERCITDPELLDRLKAGATLGREEARADLAAGWSQLIRRIGPRCVNLGAGEDVRPGAINVDIRRVPGVDVVASAEALPFADGAIDALVAQDLLEHFPGERSDSLLAEWVRVLRPGAKLRVQTPDVRALAQALLRGKLSTDRTVEWLYGAQDHPFNFHYAGFDEARLRGLLEERGVVEIERRRDGVSSKNVCLEGVVARQSATGAAT